MAENSSGSPVFGDRYRLQPVGNDWDRGRSGYTHLIFDIEKERLGVIKRAELKSQQAVEELKNEIGALLDLKGFGVPEVYDTGEAEYRSKNYFYTVIEYIEGIRVEKNLNNLTVVERAGIITQLFGLLAKAHQIGIANGDVDLKHLFWRRDNQQLVVIDWGNAKLDIDQKEKTEFAFDLARSAEIIFSLMIQKGHPPISGSIALPNDSDLISGIPSLPIEFHVLCKWAPRTPIKITPAPLTALELFTASKQWYETVKYENSSKEPNVAAKGKLEREKSEYSTHSLLGNLYTHFSRIDIDTRGGYARVAEVHTGGKKGFPEVCAFKLMRPEIGYEQGLSRFEDELKILVDITRDSNAPTAITRIFDSGFVPVGLSQNLKNRETPDGNMEIISTGLDINDFHQQAKAIWKYQAGNWLPYLVVELAPFDDSMLRQIHNQPTEDSSGLFRLPTGEVIAMAIQLLDVMEYLHENQNRAYMDWKPEHLFWNGMDKQVKLIDWNVTTPLDDGPGEKQNIRDDLRLFCGAVLYISLTFVDPDDPTKPIGPRPTKELDLPVPEIRRRYWTDTPNFYQRDSLLDDEIKRIIRWGLDPKQGFDSIQQLRTILIEYANEELGMTRDELMLLSVPHSPYFKALTEVHLAKKQLFQAQQHLIEAVESHGTKAEFTRMFDAIKRALMNFPVS